MSRVEEIEEETPPPSGGGNDSKPFTPTGSKANQLTSELKVLKLQEKVAKLKKKLKSKKPKGQEESSSSSNEEVNASSSSSDESKPRKAKAKRSMGLSLLITQLLSTMTLCPLTIPSHPCTPKRRSVLMGQTIPSGIMG
jgi:hypothetical protein